VTIRARFERARVDAQVSTAVLGILMAIAAPSMYQMLQNNRLSTRANDVVTALALARTEAIKRGEQINVAATGGSWANGITVEETTGTDIRVFPAFTGGLTLTEAGGITTLGYTDTGRATTAVTFSICDSSRTGETGRQVSVSLTGRTSTTTLVCP